MTLQGKLIVDKITKKMACNHFHHHNDNNMYLSSDL